MLIIAVKNNEEQQDKTLNKIEILSIITTKKTLN